MLLYRFKKLTHKAKEVDQLLVSREQKATAAKPKKKARLLSTASNVSQSGRGGDIAPPQATEDDIALSQLYSTRAFADFLRQRPNYSPPSFLAAILYDSK